MKAILTAIIAAIEACAVALAAFVAIGIPAVLLWWLLFDLAAEPTQVASVGAAVWQLAHFVPIEFTLSPEAALGFGLAPEALAFPVSLAPLGLTVLTVSLAVRSGLRFGGRGSTGAYAVLGGSLGFAAAAAVIAVFAAPLTVPPLWVAIAVPAFVYGAASGVGYLWRAGSEGQEWWQAAVRWVQRGVQGVSATGAAALPARAAECLRLAAAAVAGLVGVAALGSVVALVAGYVEIVSLSQALQLDVLGAVVLLLVHAALLPVMLVWALAWFSGAGFTIGSATSVTPFETLLGPVPALPLMGAVPQGWGWAGGIAPALVVLLAVVLGAIAGGRRELRQGSAAVALVVPVLAGLLTGLVVTALAAAASGSIGPGRLAETGPDAWAVGGLIALEMAFGLSLGVFTRRADALVLKPAHAEGEARSGDTFDFVDLDPADTFSYPLRVPAEPVVQADVVEPMTPVPTAVHPAATIEAERPTEAEDPLIEAFSWENGGAELGTSKPKRRMWQGDVDPG